MTSKKSSGNAIAFTFRQGFKSLTTLAGLIMCGIITFCTTLYTITELFGTTALYDENGNISEYIINKEKYHFLIFRDAEYMSFFLILAVVACGIVAAICSFNFITSKKMVNVYYSLGITRTKLFCGKYFSGILMLFIAVALPMLVIFFANIFSVGYSLSLFKAATFYFIYFFLLAATSFTVTSAVFAAVGTTFETAIFSTFILFIPDVFLFSIQALMDTFLYGTPYGQRFSFINDYNYNYNDSVATLPDQFGFLSPVFWGKEQIAKLALSEKEKITDTVPAVSPDFLTAFLWFVLTVAIFFLAILLFNKRKAEICGFIGTNRVLNTTVSILAGFAAFCYAVNSFDDEMLIGIIVGALAFAAVHLILEAVVLRDMKKFARGLYKLPVGIAVSVAITLIFNSGLFGFSQKLPELSDIQSVSVTSVSNTSEYGLFSDGWTYVTTDLDYYAAPQSLTGEFTTEKDIKAVLDVHRSITESEEADRTLNSEIQFIYTLKNGKTLKRSFYEISPETYKKALYLEDCDFYDAALKNLFTGEIKTYNIYEQSPRTVVAEAQKNLRNNYYVEIYSRYADKVFSLTLSEKDRLQLLDALYKDISSRSAEEKYYPASQPIGFISFSVGDSEITADTAPEKTEITENPFSAKFAEFLPSNQWSPYFCTHITPDMVNTISLLKNLGIYDRVTASPGFITAEVIPAEEAIEIAYAEDIEYIFKSLSRCFVSRYSAVKSTNTQEGNWTRYENTVDTHTNHEIHTDKAVINSLLSASYTVYEQDYPDKGWFVSFRTADGDTSICYIPDGKLPSGIS